MTSAEDVDDKLKTHEEVCAERYRGIMQRIGRLEWLIIASAGGIISALATVAYQMAARLAHL